MTNKQAEYEEKIKSHMTKLECTREEAIDIIQTDEIIDKGGRTKYDLTKEDEKIALKISGVNERKSKSADNKRGKVRAENPIKGNVIAKLYEFLNENAEIGCENVEILNKEKLIAFKIGDNSFELDLKQKRKPKN